MFSLAEPRLISFNSSMPGTIQISVLDLVDLPPEAKTHLLSLKVLMGKREYQATGTGDFSFPVVSLRENLVVMMLDMEGSVVFRTAELKTKTVVEKGIWDDLFPLEGGGCVRMKLQFSLSEEEQKRIREMRDSALKKKHAELLKGDLRSSLSEYRRSFDQSITANRPNQCGNPSTSASMQKLEEPSAESFEQGIPHPTKISEGIIEIQPPSDVSQERHISLEKCLDVHTGGLGSFVSGNDTENISSTSFEVEEDQISSPKRNNLLQRRMNSNTKLEKPFEESFEQAIPHPSKISYGTIEIQSSPDGIQERHISLEKCLDTPMGGSGSLVMGSDTENIGSISSEVEEDQIHSPKGKNLLQRSLNSNIKLKEPSQESFEQPIPHPTKVNNQVIEIQPSPDDIQERHTSLEKCLDTPMGGSGSLVLRNDTENIRSTSSELEEDQVRSSKRKILLQRSLNSNIKLEEPSEESFELDIPHPATDSNEVVKIQPPADGIQERHVPLEKDLDTRIGGSESLVSGDDTENMSSTSSEVEEHQIRSSKKKNVLQKSLNSNISKMISAFENNTSQGLGPHAGLRTKPQASKIHIGDFLMRVSSRESDTEKVKLPQTMAKSFSSETLSDISFQQSPKFSKYLIVDRNEDTDLDHGTGWETTGNNNPFLDLKTDVKNSEASKHEVVKVKEDEGSSVDTLHIAESQSPKSTNTLLRPLESGETDSLSGSAQHPSERENPIPLEVEKGPIISLHTDFIPQDAHGASDTLPSCENSEEPEALGSKGNPLRETNQSRDEMDDGIGTIEQIVADNSQPREVNFELVHKEENKNEGHTLLEEYHLSRKMLYGSVYVEEPCSQSDEQTVSGSPIETTELSTYYEYEKYPFSSLGIWIPQRLCSTTGSKQLKNLVGCSSIHTRTHSVEKASSSMEADEKQKMHDDICIEVSKIEKISCSSEKPNLENSEDIPKLHRGLIEQGLRIITILVASGTILLNTRQRKPR